MLHRRGGEDALAPGDVMGVELTGEMDTAFGGRALAGNHAVADDGQRTGCGVTAGNFGGLEGGGVSAEEAKGADMV